LNESTNPTAPPILDGPMADLAEAEALARRLAAICVDAKAVDVRAMRVLELVQYTDFFLICTGRSDRHVRAVYEALKDETLKARIKPLSVEGIDAGQWICCDYGSVVVHIFYEPVREFYALERLWSDAPELTL
jgi:ribosome-associated protein